MMVTARVVWRKSILVNSGTLSEGQAVQLGRPKDTLYSQQWMIDKHDSTKDCFVERFRQFVGNCIPYSKN